MHLSGTVKNLAISSLAVFLFFNLSANESEQFREKFNDGIRHLSVGRIAKAQPIFQELYEMDPSNANINYLLGICYAEQNIADIQSVKHLEMAEREMVIDYNVHSFKEKEVPIYVYYYLVLAYSQNGLCDKAREARDNFYSYYTFYVEYDFYIEDAQRWVERCHQANPEQVPSTEPLLVESDGPEEREATVKKFVKELRTVPLKDRNLSMRDVYYFTRSPLWGVQIGAFEEFLPQGEFDELKNVDAFLAKDGMVRYVVGHFSHRKQAESLQEVIAEAGYLDAFVVNINREKKFTREVLAVNNIPLKKKLKGDVYLSVQIGAFREDSIPKELADIYLQIDGIEEHPQDELTILTVGSFSSYGSAAEYRDDLLEMGIPGAFIVAFEKNKKVSLQQAIRYLQRHHDKGM